MKERKEKLKKNAFEKIFSVLISFVFALSCFSVSVNGGDSTKILLALGDSISAGYGLENVNSECFVYGILDKNGKVINKAVSGNTAKDILNQIQNSDNENHISLSQIQSADYVTITCGGNDMMDILYQKTANEWNKSNPDSQITPDEVPLKMVGSHLGVLLTIMDILNPESQSYLLKDEGFEKALTEYFEILGEIISYINSSNPQVAVIVATQYNPYFECKGTNFDIVYRGMEEGISKLNDAIKKKSQELGYVFSDVKGAFDSYNGEGDLYNADIATMNLDFHPSAEGHKILAESFKKTISEIVYAKYTVIHHFEALEGGFEEKKFEYKAVLGKTITAEKVSREGFSYKEGAEGEIKTLSVEDGSVFKLYYSRNVYKVGWHTYDDIVFENYKYGEKINEPTAKRKGYVFISWDKDIPETMPAKDITYVAFWKKKSNAPIIIVVLSIVLIAGAILYVIHLKENIQSKKSDK